MKIKSMEGAHRAFSVPKLLALAAVAVFILAASFVVTDSDESDAAAKSFTITETVTNATCDSTVKEVTSGSVKYVQFNVNASNGYMFSTSADISVTCGSVASTDITKTTSTDKSYIKVKIVTTDEVGTSITVSGSAHAKVKVTYIGIADTTKTEDQIVPGGVLCAYTFKAVADYKYPTSVEVKVGTTVAESTKYIYSATDGKVTLKASAFSGSTAITVTMNYVPTFEKVIISSVTKDPEHPDVKTVKAPISKAFTYTFPAVTGYNFPENITVTVDDQAIGFTYKVADDKKTALLTILATALDISKEIHVKIVYEAKHYTFNATVSNSASVTPDSASPAHDSKLIVTIVPKNGYDFPDEVVVMNGNEQDKSVVYDSVTGKLTVNTVLGNITVTGTCGAKTFNLTYMDGDTVLSESLINSILSEDQKKKGATFMKYTFNEEKSFPLPWDVKKTDYVFVKWIDADGKEWKDLPAGTYGDKTFYAVYKDDMSIYDLGEFTMPFYLIAAISVVLALLAMMAATRRK